MNRLNLEKLAKGFVSHDEFRPALVGAYYDTKRDALVVTDGHKLFVLKSLGDHITMMMDDKDFKGSPILPVEILAEYEKRTKGYSLEKCREFCRLLITGKGTNEDPFFAEYQEDKNGKGFKTYAGAECIDENYPDYETVIPAKGDLGEVDAIGINPVYLHQIWMAVKSWDNRAAPVVKLLFKDERAPIMVELFNAEVEALNCTCLIMPVRLIN